jgi:hypothetical protein
MTARRRTSESRSARSAGPAEGFAGSPTQRRSTHTTTISVPDLAAVGLPE